MQFSNITGQEEVKYQLTELVQKNRLSHALLFLGREGNGTLPMAIAFAQYVLCEKVSPGAKRETAISLFGGEKTIDAPLKLNDSCGQCASCHKVSKLIHPDLHFSYPVLKRDSKHDRIISTDYITDWRGFVQLFPYGNVADWINFLKESPKAKIENAINKQGNITVQECDEITRKLSLKAFESAYKILIMWMPEFLGKEGNKLLKLIEEPPPDTLFIFVAEDENSILPTILSRTQLIKIPPVSNKEIENFLENAHSIASEKAVQLSALAEGNMREALLLLNHTEEDWQAQVRKWLNVTLKNNVNAQLKWIDEMSATGREKQKQFLKYFIHLLQQAIRMRYLQEDNILSIPEDERDFAFRLNNMCTFEAQEALITELDKAIYYVERNAHAKMLFHALTIRFFHIIKDNSLILVH